MDKDEWGWDPIKGSRGLGGALGLGVGGGLSLPTLLCLIFHP